MNNSSVNQEHPDPFSANADATASRCPQCNGDMHYDAAAQSMLCAHCGHSFAVPDSEGRRSVVEHDLEHGLARARSRGYGTPVRTSLCQECGAAVSFSASLTATRCDFCGSSQVLSQEENRNVLRPESLVPFGIDREAAQAKFSAWLKGLWFRPSNLAREARVVELSGVYIPYWTFDATVRSDWTAQAGYYYYVTETYTERDAQGNQVTKTRQVRKVRWQPAWGARTDEFDDVLVCASRGLPGNLAVKLEPFDTGALRPYDPSYLAGWKAEEYAVELNEGWKGAVERMESVQESRCRGDVPGDTHRALNVVNQFRDETFKHVLLPIWISSYRYGDEVYRFLVNGQTGEVSGKAPYSVPKIVLFVLFIAAIIAAVIWWTQRG